MFVETSTSGNAREVTRVYHRPGRNVQTVSHVGDWADGTGSDATRPQVIAMPCLHLPLVSATNVPPES
jgi:hypothetical protein